jgi:molybdenum cofactor synthesis domain-containing protein
MNDTASTEAIVTAGLLVIGDEILSGRTKDKNIGYIAEYLTAIGVDLREVRVVPDVEEEIVSALNALRHKYTYVFTTGGIGPTHDDITAECVAKAFGFRSTTTRGRWRCCSSGSRGRTSMRRACA